MTPPASVPLADIARVFARIGVLSFGGPAAQIALMHRELVEQRKWLTEREYLSALSFCMLLPGPEAMQLATWAGWRLHGTAGGLIAGLLFVLPGACVVLALAMSYAAFGEAPLVAAMFLGVKAAVVVIVIEAMLRLSRRAFRGGADWAIAGLAFLGLFLFDLPFPLIVFAAGLWGFLRAQGAPVSGPAPGPAIAARTGRTVAVWGAVWLVPLAALWLLERGMLWEIGLFTSQLAVVTFGGAYAVLTWMTQTVVADMGWLTLPQMIDGLGLAETTPGPLILVVEFVSYQAGYGAGGAALGVKGAAVALWMTFAPCFLWIFAGAPWLDRIARAPRLSGALSAITAAVVGVILNLSVWFAAHVFFAEVGQVTFGPARLIAPVAGSAVPLAAGLAALAGLLILRLRAPLPLVLAICALIPAATVLV